MSTLDSTSTWAEIQASYDDNASYEEDSSVAKARAFVTACRLLLRDMPKRSAHGSGRGSSTEIEMDTRLIKEELQAAQQWLSVNGGGASGNVKHADVSNFRS